jgi:hypothetical protein
VRRRDTCIVGIAVLNVSTSNALEFVPRRCVRVTASLSVDLPIARPDDARFVGEYDGLHAVAEV